MLSYIIYLFSVFIIQHLPAYNSECVFRVFKDANLHLFLYYTQNFIVIMSFFYKTRAFYTSVHKMCKQKHLELFEAQHRIERLEH